MSNIKRSACGIPIPTLFKYESEPNIGRAKCVYKGSDNFPSSPLPNSTNIKRSTCRLSIPTLFKYENGPNIGNSFTTCNNHPICYKDSSICSLNGNPITCDNCSSYCDFSSKTCSCMNPPKPPATECTHYPDDPICNSSDSMCIFKNSRIPCDQCESYCNKEGLCYCAEQLPTRCRFPDNTCGDEGTFCDYNGNVIPCPQCANYCDYATFTCRCDSLIEDFEEPATFVFRDEQGNMDGIAGLPNKVTEHGGWTIPTYIEDSNPSHSLGTIVTFQLGNEQVLYKKSSPVEWTLVDEATYAPLGKYTEVNHQIGATSCSGATGDSICHKDSSLCSLNGDLIACHNCASRCNYEEKICKCE